MMRIVLIALVSLCISTGASAQTNYNYVMQFDTQLDLGQFETANGYLDLAAIESVDSTASADLQELRMLMTEIVPQSARRLLRHLHDTVTVLYGPRGGISIAELQRIIVFDRSNQLNQSAIDSIVQSCYLLDTIEVDPLVILEDWQPDDPLYGLQEQLHTTAYNIDVERAWCYTRGNSNVRVGVR